MVSVKCLWARADATHAISWRCLSKASGVLGLVAWHGGALLRGGGDVGVPASSVLV